MLLKHVSSSLTLLSIACLAWADHSPVLEKTPLSGMKIPDTTDQPAPLVRVTRLRLVCPLRLVSLHLARSCLMRALGSRDRGKLDKSLGWDYSSLKNQAD